MKVNGESIYGTTSSPLDYDFWWGAMTQKEQTIYLHALEWPKEGLEFNGIKGQAKKAYFLADETKTALPLTYNESGHVTKIVLPAEAPDARNTVIAVEYETPIEVDAEAKGEYHWYTTRSKRHTKILHNKHAGNTKNLHAVTGEHPKKGKIPQKGKKEEE